MSRWEPDPAGRFRAAAMELFGEVGYDRTTVAAIAERAGLTARTFFRYFADKREVLFDGSDRLQHVMLAALENAPPEASALDAAGAALRAPAEFFGEPRRAYARMRSTVIAANAELRERELIKLANLTTALADGLRRRGVPEPDATLVAEAALGVFRVAFAHWVADAHGRAYAALVDESLGRLKALAAGA